MTGVSTLKYFRGEDDPSQPPSAYTEPFVSSLSLYLTSTTVETPASFPRPRFLTSVEVLTPSALSLRGASGASLTDLNPVTLGKVGAGEETLHW